MRFLSQKFKMNLFIKYFGLTKVPLIFYCRPKGVKLSNSSVTLKIPLLRRTKNHVGSMYIGALAVGADLTSALLALNIINKSKIKIMMTTTIIITKCQNPQSMKTTNAQAVTPQIFPKTCLKYP